MNNPLSLKDAFYSAWATFKKHAGVFVTVTFVFLILGVVLGSVDKNHQYGAVAGIANILISFFAAYVMIRFSLVAIRGGVPQWREIFNVTWGEFGWYIFASILVSLMQGIGIVLLIIPGLILLARLALFSFALIDEDLLPIDSIKRSWELTKGRFWQMFFAGVIIIALNIVGAMLFGIGVLVSSPLSFIFSAYIYEKLRNASVPIVIEKTV
ncbi:MAG: hypothetical protein COV01_03365 [Candidatus Taylorbacteria bacterium CG10_big_fil_rev_8_21_14_0_10_41_48]|uniref:DUF7847 domain-containing protein n=1 Tax=Candidatus Taylorbacteria bacterium CG10_big_fil_rev_8_21_14_0_10_41_48 TaxID=1975024 RepID=A0A2M8LB44_9BACT|nr:MAG: hypothetical protein COV01_03365 [Candidatus Taylorbacteria bacterium CG10_big_fil_rev_8_21_14_0_10_41_48]